MADLRSLENVTLLPELMRMEGFEFLWRISALNADWKATIGRVAFEWQPDGIRKTTEMRCLNLKQFNALRARFAQMPLRSIALHVGGPLGAVTLHQLLGTS